MLAELLELAPERRRAGGRARTGCEGVVEYAIYGARGRAARARRARGGGRRRASSRCDSREVPDDWAERWKRFYFPVLVGGRLYVRPPWEEPAQRGGVEEVVIDPGGAFGTGTHPTTRMCLELLLEAPARGSFRDLGCGSGVLSIAAAKLGFEPVLGVDADRAAVDETERNARANYVEVEVRRVDLRTRAGAGRRRGGGEPDARACARPWRARGRSAASGRAPRSSPASCARRRTRRRRRSRQAAWRSAAASSARRLGARSWRILARLAISAVTTFHIKFLGCKVSQADAMLARAALLEAGHEEAPEDEADLHVVNTCCITREAEAKSRQSVRRSARGRAGRRVVVTGCAANLNAAQFDEIAPRGDGARRHRGRRRRRGRGRRGAGLHRRRDRRARAPAAVGDPHPRLREGAGRLRLPLLVLHHPQGPRRRPLAPGERGAATRCAGASSRASRRW